MISNNSFTNCSEFCGIQKNESKKMERKEKGNEKRRSKLENFPHINMNALKKKNSNSSLNFLGRGSKKQREL